MDLNTINKYITTVQLIKRDISNDLTKPEILEKWKVFSLQSPKIFDAVFTDPKCLERLETMKRLCLEIKSNDISNYDASLQFGKYISKDYLPAKTKFN